LYIFHLDLSVLSTYYPRFLKSSSFINLLIQCELYILWIPLSKPALTETDKVRPNSAQRGPIHTLLLLSHFLRVDILWKAYLLLSRLSLKLTSLGFWFCVYFNSCKNIPIQQNPKIWVNNNSVMDSRDSLSSDAVRDASSLSDDAAVLSVTSTLAKTALSYFQSGKFEECIDVLIQLDQMKHNDPKVQFFFSSSSLDSIVLILPFYKFLFDSYMFRSILWIKKLSLTWYRFLLSLDLTYPKLLILFLLK